MRSVEEHLTKILDLVAAAAAVRAAAAGGDRAADLRGHQRRRSTCPASTTPRWTAMPVARRPASTPSTDNPVTLPVVGESAAGQTQGLRAVARPGGQDHDRVRRCRPVPTRSSRSSGPTAVGPTCRDHASRRSPASTCGRAATTSGPATLLIEEGTMLGPREATILAATGHASGQGAAAPARRRALDRDRAARAGTPSSASTRSTTPTRSRSRRRRARPTRSPTGSASSATTRRSSPTRCPTSWCAPTWS